MIGFQSSILAGTTLIRSAIQSPNYVSGSAGWSINQDGSVEFNNAVIRGEVLAGNGRVRLNSGGLAIDGTLLQFDINFGGGFVARRLPDDGGYGQLTMADSTAGSSLGGGVFMSPTDPTPVNGNTFANVGSMYVDTEDSGGTDTPVTYVRSPVLTGKTGVSMIALRGQSSTSTPDDSYAQVYGHLADENLTGIASTAANFGPVAAEVVFLQTAAIDWLANSAYRVKVWGRFQPTNTTTPRVGWNIRKTNAAGQTLVAGGRQTGLAAEPYNTYFEGVFRVGAATINRVVCLTMFSGSAPGVNNITAIAPFFMEIYWMGDSANYADATEMT